MSTKPIRALAVLTLVLGLPACISHAPPIRGHHYGAPGRMDAGMVEVNGSALYFPELSGAGMLGYGVSEELSVEAGTEFDPASRVLGFVGVRYTPLRPKPRLASFVLDVESGVGAGVGGLVCDDAVNCSSQAANLRRPAGGAYLGLGIGAKIKWFSPWLRVRSQVSGAEGTPVTSISSAIAGVQFDITELAHVYAGAGGGVLVTPEFTQWGWQYIQGGVSFTLATPRTRRLRAQRAAE